MNNLSIVGIGPVSVNRTEYLSEDVLNDFNTSIQKLLAVLNKGPANDYAAYSDADYVKDYDTVQAAVNSLAKLATDGRVVTVPDGTSYTAYLNGDMAQALDNVMRTLKLVGISADPADQNKTSQEKITAIQSWQQMSGLGVYDILQTAALLKANAYNTVNPSVRDVSGNLIPIARSPTRTLQSMLELEYVKVGNDIFSTNLDSLEQALNLTKQAIDQLYVAQNIANQLIVQPKSGFTLPTTTNTLDFKDQYKALAQAYFGGSSGKPAIIPIPTPSSTAPQQLYTVKLELEKVKAALAGINSASAAQSGSLAQTIGAVIQDISAQFSKLAYSGSLEYLLRTNPTLFNTTFKSAVSAWILDGQNNSVNSTNPPGAIYKKLTQAIQTAENLNDAQREDVRRYLHVFEEFYKSTAGMLTTLAALFSKITRGITGG